MVVLGEVLVVGGSALVVCSAILLGLVGHQTEGACGDRMRLWASRRKSRDDDDEPRHSSGRRGSYRVPSAPALVRPEIDSPGFASTDRVGIMPTS